MVAEELEVHVEGRKLDRARTDKSQRHSCHSRAEAYHFEINMPCFSKTMPCPHNDVSLPPGAGKQIIPEQMKIGHSVSFCLCIASVSFCLCIASGVPVRITTS